MSKELLLPRQSEELDESLISFWHVQEGDSVEKGDSLVEVQTEKAIADVEATESGILSKIIKERGDTAKVGDPLAVISESSESSDVQEESTDTKEIKTKATPKVKKLAKDLSIDWKAVTPSEGTKVTVKDIERFAEKDTTDEKITTQKEKTPDATEKEQQIIPLTGIRKSIVRNLTDAISTIPHVTHFQEVNVEKTVQMRTELKESFAEEGVKLTYIAFVVKALVETLKLYPYLNSKFDAENEEIILNEEYHIGIATDTENGLLVPVIKQADKKSLFEISKEVQELASKARDGRLSADEMTGGSSTISNVGSASGSFFTPIINASQSTILGIGRINKKMIVIEDEGVIKPMMPLSLSYDHRLIDGILAQDALNQFSEFLANPSLLLAKPE